MQPKQKFWAGSSALAGAGLVACGACCVPLASMAIAALGLGAISRGMDEVVSLIVGATLVLISVLLWFRSRKKPRSCTSSGSQCGCEPAIKAPIACTLTPGEFKERSTWLKDLSSRALLSHVIFTDHALLRYRLDARADVETMVKLERACCAFLEFDINEVEDHLLVTIKARDQDVGDLSILLSHLTPDRTGQDHAFKK